MKQIIRFRWLIFSAWLLVMFVLVFFSPSLQQLVAEKGQITVPEGYPSQQADELIQKLSNGSQHSTGAVLVFHNEKGLTNDDKEEVSQAIKQLKQAKDDLEISDIIDYKESKEIKKLTVAEDGKTILVPFNISFENQSADESRNKIYKALNNITVEHHVTGEMYINEDIIKNSEEGLKKTIYITIILILIILFIVFKSFIAPLIPLVTIGISYIIAQNIVAILAKTVDFPLSTYTQIFMVAVMFGIGTDYCILLISRFKEELTEQQTIKEAVIATYKSGGKTIFYAGLAVLVGFSTIGLSSFSLYQSAVAVAIGVAITLIALTTLVPFFLVLLGKKLFFPFDKQVAHKESAVWRVMGTFAWSRPLLALLIVFIVTVPAIIFYNSDKSYDNLQEIGDDFGSVIGFNWITESFGSGDALPTTVVMEVDHPIQSLEDFQAIENISQEILRLDGIAQVRSSTRPTGEIIDDFLIKTQTDLLADGLGEGIDGLNEIEGGIREAATEIEKASPELTDAQNGVSELMAGTQAANDGIGEIKDALAEIKDGIFSGSKGTEEVKSGLTEIKTNLDETITGQKELLNGYQQIAEGLAHFGTNDEVNANQLNELTVVLENSKQNVETMNEKTLTADPLLQQDEAYMEAYFTALGQIDGAIEAIQDIQTELSKLANIGTTLNSEVVQPLNELNDHLSEVIAGHEQISTGINELISGIDELESGLNEVTEGQGQVIDSIPSVQNGLSDIYGGQNELKTAFTDMQTELDKLASGLLEGADGLEQIDDGLSEAKDYLQDITIDTKDPVVIIPEEAIDNEDFLEGANFYLSDDKKIVRWEVILTHHPYSKEALQLVDVLDDQVTQAKSDTIFADSQPFIGGVSSMNNDLKNISNKDYSRTVFLMLIGIFLILIILLRSLIMPIYLIGSLVLTYFTSMAFAEFIFVHIFKYEGLTWAIPFFSFVMLIALGIDYSIFLMDRFSEYSGGLIKEALLTAMKNMGTVIISATIILGGTFGAMLPSGVLSLLQIATVVIIGLTLYAFVMLPLFTPVMVRFFGKYNWWPFKQQMKNE